MNEQIDNQSKDGVVRTEFDGFGIWIRISDFSNHTDEVYLEPKELRALINFADSVGMKY